MQEGLQARKDPLLVPEVRNRRYGHLFRRAVQRSPLIVRAESPPSALLRGDASVAETGEERRGQGRVAGDIRAVGQESRDRIVYGSTGGAVCCLVQSGNVRRVQGAAVEGRMMTECMAADRRRVSGDKEAAQKSSELTSW